MSRVTIESFLIGIALCLTAGCGGYEQPYPSRPIDVITHASPGGGTDTTARAMLVGARQALGVDMAVVFKGGGGGVVAINYVNDQPRDGYTVMSITPTHLFAIARGQGALSIDDLVGLARATEDPLVITVRANGEIETLDELATLGRARPIKWGTGLIGGIDHMAGLAFARTANAELSAVPFPSGGEVATNLMGGNIDVAGLNLTEALDELQRGDFRALAVMADERIDTIPDVPTTIELGYEVTYSTVRGYVVLRDTPEERIRALERGLLAGLEHSAFQSYLDGVGLTADGIASREIWDVQIRELYASARRDMIELGMIED